MKKTLCLLAVLAIASTAGARIDVIKDGMVQPPWYVDTGPWQPLVTAPDYWTPAVRFQGSGWAEIRGGGVDIGDDLYLEYHVWFASAEAGSYFEAMHLDVNGDGGWTYKWQDPTTLWVDGVQYSAMDAAERVAAMTQDAWHTVRIDLTTNCLPMVGPNPLPLPATPSIGTIILAVGPYGNSGDVYLSDMAFVVPEPASMLLLGLGGLALIRRKL